jgi:hypothetical protein
MHGFYPHLRDLTPSATMAARRRQTKDPVICTLVESLFDRHDSAMLPPVLPLPTAQTAG